MNHCVPDWNMDDDFLPTIANQKKSMGLDHELVELLWHNGQVVLHSQTHRKPGPTCNDSGQIQKPDRQPSKGGGSYGNLGSLIQEDETASWLQYPLEDSLDKDFCPNFLCELPSSHQIEAEKQNKQFEGDRNINFGATQESNFQFPSGTPRSQQPGFKQSNNPNVTENTMPPPRLKIPDSVRQDPNMGGANRIVNFSHFSRPIKAELGSLNGLTTGKGSGYVTGGDNGESSVMTIGSSHCGSNQLQNDADLSRVSSNVLGTAGIFAGQEDIQKLISQCERRHSETLDPTVTSSSGGSGGSFGGTGKQSTSTHSHKRKGRDADESECPSEEAEFESAEANKQTRRSGSSRRSRAAEVHNLSERRRRDRINEKMKALQELIPHCNKSDKASMLDEAIEYLKSLQLQVQLMWMGSGMAPMIFPGVQHYLSRMGMGMGPPSLPSIHNPMQLPRVPLEQATSSPTTPNQPSMFASPVVNQVNFQNQLQSPNYPESYARYMGFHHMQTAQPMNIFNYGSQTVQQSHKIGGPNGIPCQGGSPSDNTQNC